MINQHFQEAFCPQWEDFPDIELYMDQVISVLERYLAPFSEDEKLITSTMINNYVKQKIIPPPKNKRYSRSQLALLLMVCVWKRFMQLSHIALLLENLLRERSVKEAYGLFEREFNHSIQLVFHQEAKPLPDPQGDTEAAVRAACFAFAAIVYSRTIFLKAGENWKPAEAEEAEKEKTKKEKKEKKEKEKSRENKKKSDSEE